MSGLYHPRLVRGPKSHPRIHHFSEAGIGALPEGEEYANPRLENIMSGLNLAETAHFPIVSTREITALFFNDFIEDICLFFASP